MEKLTKHANGQWTLEKASPENDMHHACKSDKEPHEDDPKHEEKEKQKAKDIKSKAEEILDMHKDENGSLEKDAANPALAPKEVKVKELQRQIDAGKYKVDSKKVADKMVSKLKLNKGGQWTLDGGDV